MWNLRIARHFATIIVCNFGAPYSDCLYSLIYSATPKHYRFFRWYDTPCNLKWEWLFCCATQADTSVTKHIMIIGDDKVASVSCVVLTFHIPMVLHRPRITEDGALRCRPQRRVGSPRPCIISRDCSWLRANWILVSRENVCRSRECTSELPDEWRTQRRGSLK